MSLNPSVSATQIVGRRATDSNFSYRSDYLPEALGSSNFITKTGRLRLAILFKAVSSVVARHGTVRLCEMALNIVDLMLNLGCLKDDKGGRQSEEFDLREKSDAKPPGTTDDDIVTLLTETLIKIFLTLGCPHGCNEASRTPHVDFLRRQARWAISRVEHVASRRLTACIARRVRETASTAPQKLLDFAHAFTGFCRVDPRNPETIRKRSGSTPKSSTAIDDKKAASYRNNFLEDTKGVEGVLVDALLKPLVTKLMTRISQLQQPENMALYHDVRSLMSYVQESHGNPFRRVELSALLDARKPVPTSPAVDAAVTPGGRGSVGGKHSDSQSLDSGADKKQSSVGTIVGVGECLTAETAETGGSNEPDSRRNSPVGSITSGDGGQLLPPTVIREQTSLRRGLFIKKQKTDKDKNSDDSDGESSCSPGTPRNILISDDTIASSSSPLLPSFSKKKQHSSGKLHFAFNLLKSVKSENNEDASDSDKEQSLEDLSAAGLDSDNSEKTTGRRATKITSKSSAKQATSSGGLKKMGHSADSTTGEEGDPTDESQTSKLSRMYSVRDQLIIPPKNLVNLLGIRQGAKRLSFLLETCRPGTVPDPPLLAALLDLRAPVLSRAVVFVECAYFVNRCNRGEWPEWIRSSGPGGGGAIGGGRRQSTIDGGALGNRGTPSGVRRTHIIQRAAARMFYEWGVEIGRRLEELQNAEKLTAEKLVAMPFNEQDRRQLRIEDDLEDFLDEASVNKGGNECPMALKMLACVLLTEITAFLRESYQTIPKGRTQSRPGLHPGWEKLMSHRRWSILSSTFNPQQQTTAESVQSIADVAAVLHPQTEKRISFSTPEDNSPRGSNGTIEEVGMDVPTDKKGWLSRRGESVDTSISCAIHRRPPKLSARPTFFRAHSVRSQDDDVNDGPSSPPTLSRPVSRHAIAEHQSSMASLVAGVTFSREPSQDSASAAAAAAVASAGRRLAQGRQRLLKRGAPGQLEGSIGRRRTSIRLKGKKKDGDAAPFGDAEDSDDGSRKNSVLTVHRRSIYRRRSSMMRGDVSAAATTSAATLQPPQPLLSAAVTPTSPQLMPTTIVGIAAALLTRKESAKSSRDDVEGGGGGTAASPADGAGATGTSMAHADESDEDSMHRTMPWLKVAVRLSNSFNFVCDHQRCCHPNCYERSLRQSHRLMIALRKVYGEQMPLEGKLDRRKALKSNWQQYQDAKRKRSSGRHSVLSGPRRESANVRQPAPLERASTMQLKSLLIDKLNEIDDNSKDKDSNKAKKSATLAEDEENDISKERKKPKKESPKLKYLSTKVKVPIHAPLSTMLKAAVILSEHNYQDVLPVAWEMLLQSNYHVTSCAAALFIVASVRQPDQAVKLVRDELQNTEPSRRTCALARFYALWRNRYHCWLKMEEGAHMIFKVPPPNIDFTLPSPAIGVGQTSVVDPPWMPHMKTKVEELSLKEEEDQTVSQTIMTMTKTRRKQKQELVKRAVQDAEERQSLLRQQCPLLATAAAQQAAYEPALFQQPAPVATVASEDAADGGEVVVAIRQQQIPVSQPLFPSCLLSMVPLLVEMLDDVEIDSEGCSVGQVAKKIVWTCLVEEPTVFLRHFLEKLTNRERQEEMMGLLRKLLLHYPQLPSQTAFTLMNYLIGFVMYYVRSPCEGSQEAIAMALTLIWLVAPSVHGLYFKDLKQTLRKEQCDHAIMITANVPSAKKILVHGPDATTGIPSQFPIHEETQFQQILSDSLEFFNIPDDQVDGYFLIDTKTSLLHTPTSFVRDFYFFHRSFYPQLNLVRMDTEMASRKIKEMAFTYKFIDLGKAMMTLSILRNAPEQTVTQRLFFLHEELTRLPAFPRKALEACFGMYRGELGSELLSMDTMHKFAWSQLMNGMFAIMENPHIFGDLHLFVNVINGVMIMHCEEASMLRYCCATYLNLAIHFSSMFSNNGFFLIMPTVIRCYSQRQTNFLLCRVIEFLCKQFYLLHRKPFILQTLGSIANILDSNENEFEFDPMKVKSTYLFKLLLSLENLERDTDHLEIMLLVRGEKPPKALDLCYKDDPNTFCILTDCIASCITVCAVAPESRRCYQMMVVLSAVLPNYVRHLERDTRTALNSQSALKHELHILTTLIVEFKGLITCCDVLARSFSGPQRTFDIVNVSGKAGKSLVAESPQFFDHPTFLDEPKNMFNRNESKRMTAAAWEALDDSELQREVFRKPRDALLSLSAAFLKLVSLRLKELCKLVQDHSKVAEPMDHRSHVKLSEIALSLLKLAPYDPNTMACEGLQQYFLNVLPVTDWSVEHNRSALNVILKRLDKTFAKIGKKGNVRRRANWDALSNWLKGLYDTLNAFPYVAHLHPLKTTTQMCLRILIGDMSLYGDDASSSSVAHHTSSPTILHASTPPQNFCNAVLKLSSFLMQALGEQTFSLEHICGSDTLGVATDKTEAVLCHILIPLFLRAATAKKDAPQLRQKDIAFCLSYVLSAINPPLSKQSLAPTPSLGTSLIRPMGGGGSEAVGRQGSVSVTEKGHSATVSTARFVRESICQSVFLALKILILSFDKQLTNYWPKIGRIVRELAGRKSGGASLWSFMEFLIQANTPVTLMIIPLIQQKIIWQKPANDQEAHWYQELRDRLSTRVPQPRCYHSLLIELISELQQMKEDFSTRPIDAPRSHTPTIGDLHSDSGSTHSAAGGGGASGQRLSLSSRPRCDSRRLSGGKPPRLVPGGFRAAGTTPQDGNVLESSATIAEEETEGELVKSPSVPQGPMLPEEGHGFTRTRSTIRWGRGSKRWKGRTKKSGSTTAAIEPEPVQSLELQDLPRRTKSLIKRKKTPGDELPSHRSVEQPSISVTTPGESSLTTAGMLDIEDRPRMVSFSSSSATSPGTSSRKASTKKSERKETTETTVVSDRSKTEVAEDSDSVSYIAQAIQETDSTIV